MPFLKKHEPTKGISEDTGTHECHTGRHRNPQRAFLRTRGPTKGIFKDVGTHEGHFRGPAHLVLGFPLLLGSPLLLLTLLAPLALAAPVRPLSIRVAAVPFALLPTAPRGPRLRGLLSTIVLQLALLQLAILPVG